MLIERMSDVTLIWQAVGRGERQASEELLPLVYEELRRLAAARMRHESAGHTLQPTALVHEAWVRLVEDGSRTWENRAHFFGAGAKCAAAQRRMPTSRCYLCGEDKVSPMRGGAAVTRPTALGSRQYLSIAWSSSEFALRYALHVNS